MKSLIGLLVIGLLAVGVVSGLSVVALGGGAQVSLQIYDLKGKKIGDYSTYTTSGTLSFDALDYNGTPLANGVYLAAVTTIDSNGNIKRKVKKIVVLRGRARLSVDLNKTYQPNLGDVSIDTNVTAQAIIGTKRERGRYTYYVWKFDRWDIERIARDGWTAWGVAHDMVWWIIKDKFSFTANISCSPHKDVFIPCDGVIAGIAKLIHAWHLQAAANMAISRARSKHRYNYTMYYQIVVDNYAVAAAKFAADWLEILSILKGVLAR